MRNINKYEWSKSETQKMDNKLFVSTTQAGNLQSKMKNVETRYYHREKLIVDLVLSKKDIPYTKHWKYFLMNKRLFNINKSIKHKLENFDISKMSYRNIYLIEIRILIVNIQLFAERLMLHDVVKRMKEFRALLDIPIRECDMIIHERNLRDFRVFVKDSDKIDMSYLDSVKYIKER